MSRVVECRVAARLIAVKLGLPDTGAIRTLGQLHKAADKTLEQMIDVARGTLKTGLYSKAEIASELGISVEGVLEGRVDIELRHCVNSAAKRAAEHIDKRPGGLQSA